MAAIESLPPELFCIIINDFDCSSTLLDFICSSRRIYTVYTANRCHMLHTAIAARLNAENTALAYLVQHVQDNEYLLSVDLEILVLPRVEEVRHLENLYRAALLIAQVTKHFHQWRANSKNIAGSRRNARPFDPRVEQTVLLSMAFRLGVELNPTSGPPDLWHLPWWPQTINNWSHVFPEVKEQSWRSRITLASHAHAEWALVSEYVQEMRHKIVVGYQRVYCNTVAQLRLRSDKSKEALAKEAKYLKPFVMSMGIRRLIKASGWAWQGNLACVPAWFRRGLHRVWSGYSPKGSRHPVYGYHVWKEKGKLGSCTCLKDGVACP